MLRKKALAACICFCCICLFLIFLVLSACLVPIKSKQVVDVMPLYLAQIRQDTNQMSDLIDLDVFDVYNSSIEMGSWTSQNNLDLVGLKVYFWLSSDIESAKENFLWECDSWWKTTDDFVFGGSEDNQYCISYVNAQKQSTDGLCLPTGEYQSFVVFQKGRLLITIMEWAKDENSRAKDKVIKLLAEAVK